MTTDAEYRALAERLYGYGSDDGVAACDAILVLLKDRRYLQVRMDAAEQTLIEERAETESRLGKAVEALRIIHDRFAKDMEQGYKTRDKEFAVTIAKPVLSDLEKSE